ncbi:rhodopsin, GQ-coupled-like [Homalodisca vitripennis]|uniref:rhodopsin, GQ-coupled-like n=1 Tax=Homalodisca vitripennis TaxID=197043 RepID=UPI001EEA9295|nr:rhodopsin, GQ-coupled-like [Homalodisca vitripennis]
MSSSCNESEVEEWGHLPGVEPSVYYIIGALLAIVGSVGVLGNTLVLLVFTRFRRLRGPFSAFIVNLAVADLCTSLLHSMAVVSSFSQRWVFGKIGCQLYAGGVGHFGLLSIVTLAAIAVERYMVITSKPLSKSWRITQYDSRKVCVLTWIYCLAMSVPPLFGWSQYVLEGFHTSCSWDYVTRTLSNRAYYLYLLTLGFLVPVAVILYCYAFIMATILAHGRGMSSAKPNEEITLQPNVASREHIPEVGHPLSSSFRTAEIILVLVILFLVSWTPYAVVTFIAQFGDPRLVTPWVAALPAIFAKASVVYNPIVYGLSHPHFRSAARQILLHRLLGNSTSTMAHSQFSLRRVRVERAAASSPGTLRKHSQHFPRTSSIEPERHSDPSPRMKTELLRHADVEAVWQPGPGSGRVRSSLKRSKRHRKQNYNSTAITSEAMETVGVPAAHPTHAILDKTKSKTRNWLDNVKR